jgi:membrane protein implicated in regulation of membrane protease activity
MGHAYLFALVVSLGVLMVQIVAGARGGGHHGDLGHGGGGHGHAAGHAHHAAVDGDAGFWTLFLSLRFWTFAALGFGLSGTLLHQLGLAHPLVALCVAITTGLGSGLFAAMAYRMLRRASGGTEARASQASGRVGRVVVACKKGVPGQVRVEIGGSSVDLLAMTEDEEIGRGEAVIVEDVHENVARISRRPDELA